MREELDDPDIRTARLNALAAPHMAVLNDYVRGLRERYGRVPWLDPLDGGARARVLILLETPSPKGSEPRFVSRDNPSGTGRTIRRATAEAGLARTDTAIWNAVPWIIHADNARNRAPRRPELREGITLLPAFLQCLARLHTVVMAGKAAGAAVETIQSAQPGLNLISTPHPSPVYINTRPELYGQLRDGFARAASALGARRGLSATFTRLTGQVDTE